ncbi:MAG: hypothetical protein HY908_01785 [Myxococcales bacterium]|nr:hypothetical protein [Myxococcales bacterium]
MACLMAKPVVDGLENDLEGKLKVARFDVSKKAGRAYASRYGIDRVPSFVLLDPKGNVLYRKIGGSPEAAVIREQIAAVNAQ